jgi:pyridoxal 5'-phosphate synthase pdxT subunit
MVKPIAVLGLQGDFEAHVKALERVGFPAIVARRPAELEDASGLIIPGGESTTLIKLIREMGFVEAIHRFHERGRPIYGTCAGAILLARSVTNPAQFSLGLIDIEIQRNGYGRQMESFVTARGVLEAPLAGAERAPAPEPLEMVFIRAPRIRACGAGVQVLARLGQEAVLVRQGSVLAGTFHPEMGADPRVHRYVAGMAAASAVAA